MTLEKEYLIKGDYVKNLRENLLYSELYVSNILGISNFEYKSVEKGNKSLTETEVSLLAKLLNKARVDIILNVPVAKVNPNLPDGAVPTNIDDIIANVKIDN